jgi:energy-coupling factor transport system substrate-specific component
MNRTGSGDRTGTGTGDRTGTGTGTGDRTGTGSGGDTGRSLTVRRFAGVALPVASLVGAGVFLWPFLGAGLPAASAATVFAFGTAAALAGVELAAGRLDTRRLALLAALSAIDAAARAVVVTGIGGFSPIFLLILCGGYVYGADYGFLLGATTMLVSALVTGGLGPWLPYQLFAVGWVGAAAGLAGRGRAGRPTRRDVVVLAAVGVVTGYGFGAAMDVWNWTFYQSSPGLGFHVGMPLTEALSHFARFYVVTSLAYDTFRAVGNAVMVAALGAPVLVALARLRARLQVSVDESVVAAG